MDTSAEPGEPTGLPVDEWMTLTEAAELLDRPPGKIRHLARDHELAIVAPGGGREPLVPAAFFLRGAIVKGLGGTLTLLADHGFSDAEAIEWLFTVDDSLPGRPIDALREDRGKEVRRRAQVID